MTVPQYEALAIVRAGLADILTLLGEAPLAVWEPRHAADWEIVEMLDGRGRHVVVAEYQVPN